MSFRDQEIADLNASFSAEEAAEAVAYSCVDGLDIDTTAIINIGDDLSQGAMGTNPAAVATIRVMKSVIAEPQVDDLVTVALSSLTWRVVRILREDAGLWTLEAIRAERFSAR